MYLPDVRKTAEPNVYTLHELVWVSVAAKGKQQIAFALPPPQGGPGSKAT